MQIEVKFLQNVYFSHIAESINRTNTYTQYKYLRPDPIEAEIAQDTVNKEMDIKKLSEVASVTVTKQGDVKFMVIPTRN